MHKYKAPFDTKILVTDSDQEKVIIELNIDRKKQQKRFSSKILKMGENNQCRQAMTKPLPYGCIKKQDKVPSMTEFNKILDSISHNDTIGHLFTVDIKFHDINKRALLFNEIYPPIFQKNKKINPFERCALQLMSAMIRDEQKDKINTFP